MGKNGTYPTLPGGYFSLFDLILMANFAVLVVVAKFVLRFPLHIPGHSGIYWMAILLIGRRIVDRHGAGSIIGLISGLGAMLLGLGSNPITTIPKYMASGIVIDLFFLLIPMRFGPLPYAIAGAVGNLGKLLVSWLVYSLLGVPALFIAVGMTPSALSHVLFGAAGGVVAWFALKALEKGGLFRYLAARRHRNEAGGGTGSRYVSRKERNDLQDKG